MAGMGPLGDDAFGAPSQQDTGAAFISDDFQDEPLGSGAQPVGDEPPPYHSVVLDNPSTSARQAAATAPLPASAAAVMAPPTAAVVYGAPYNPEFQLSVSDPVKQGEGVAAHVSYRVASRVSLPGYRGDRTEVIRRFRDFVWLQHRLRSEFKGVIVPALPEKNVVEKYKMTADFIETRRQALAVFLRRVAAHPVLRGSPDLRLFLEASETEFGIEVARTQLDEPAPLSTGGAKKAVTGAVHFLKQLGASAQSLVQRRSDEEEEDPEYLKDSPISYKQVRAYVSDLERHLAEAHRQAARLVRHQADLGVAISEFGTAMSSLGKYEQGSNGAATAAGTAAASGAGDSFAALADRADHISDVCKQTSEHLAVSFEAPLKEFTRMVKAARKVMADRSAALSAYQAARADVDARRMRLAKLRGTPGIREEKVAESERELNDAQRRSDEAKAAYEAIVQRMGGELARFQRERSAELGAVLREFAVAEAEMAASQAQIWRSLIPGQQHLSVNA